MKGAQLEIDLSPDNRAQPSKAEAELKRYLKIEEELWMQKAGMRWFSQVDKNTKMFSFLCLRKKDKLLLNEIGNNNEDV